MNLFNFKEVCNEDFKCNEILKLNSLREKIIFEIANIKGYLRREQELQEKDLMYRMAWGKRNQDAPKMPYPITKTPEFCIGWSKNIEQLIKLVNK